MDKLTERLATGDHAITMSEPTPSLKELRNQIDETGWVHIKFTDTRGGTELGIRLDHAACDFSAADFDQASGTIHLEGNLTLNNDPVRIVADLDLTTLTGTGHLVLVEAVAG
jgi:hypothetical protein